MRAGREVVEQAVIRTIVEKPSEDGYFGTELEPQYVHLYPGGFKYRLVRGINQAGGPRPRARPPCLLCPWCGWVPLEAASASAACP